MVIWERGGKLVPSYEQFVTLFCRIFDHAPKGREVSTGLLSIKLHNCRVVEYDLEFCALAAESGWNESALMAIFPQGFKDNLVIELAC